jgi:hypothetical protein
VEVRGDHGVGGGGLIFVCSLVRCDHKAKTEYLSKHRKPKIMAITMRIMVQFTQSEDTDG